MSKNAKSSRIVPVAIVAVVVAAGGLLGPRAVELKRRTECCARLQRLARLLWETTSESDTISVAPAIEELVARGSVAREETVCRTGGGAYQFNLRPRAESEKNGDGRSVLAYESPENHGGDGACVVFVDGHAEFVDIERFRALIPESSHP